MNITVKDWNGEAYCLYGLKIERRPERETKKLIVKGLCEDFAYFRHEMTLDELDRAYDWIDKNIKRYGLIKWYKNSYIF